MSRLIKLTLYSLFWTGQCMASSQEGDPLQYKSGVVVQKFQKEVTLLGKISDDIAIGKLVSLSREAQKLRFEAFQSIFEAKTYKDYAKAEILKAEYLDKILNIIRHRKKMTETPISFLDPKDKEIKGEIIYFGTFHESSMISCPPSLLSEQFDKMVEEERAIYLAYKKNEPNASSSEE